jgi:outer membrane protein
MSTLSRLLPALFLSFLLVADDGISIDSPVEWIQAVARPSAPANSAIVPSEPLRIPRNLQDLRLEHCLALGISGNRSLARRRSALERAFHGRDIAETEVFLPELTASYTSEAGDNEVLESRVELDYTGFAGFSVRPFVSVERDNSVADTNSTSTGITISRPVLALHEHIRRRLPITRADRDILVAENDLRLAGRDLRLDIVRAYYDVQRARLRLGVRKSRVTDSQEFLEVTQKRVDTGFSAPVDIVNATINLNRAQADLIAEETNVENARDSLRQVLGLDLNDALGLAPYEPGAPGFEFDVKVDSLHMMAFHETLLNQRLAIDFADKELDIQRDRVRPQLDLSLTAERRSDSDSFFSGRDRSADDYRVELTYQTTLDFKKSARARMEQLLLSQEERHSSLKDAEVNLHRRLREAARRIEQLRLRIDLAEARLKSEQDKLTATLARYERGNVDNLEVTRAKQTVDDAQISLIESQINLVLAIESYRAILPPVL